MDEKNGETVNHFIVGEPTSQEILGDMIKVGRRGSLTAFLNAMEYKATQLTLTWQLIL